MDRRLCKENAMLADIYLNDIKSIKDYIKNVYPPGLVGEMLFKADASKYKLTDALTILETTVTRKTKYKLTLIGDAKAKTNKFGLVSKDGDPVYCGHFLENGLDPENQQYLAEARALFYAVKLCRDYILYKKIKASDFTLYYLTDSTTVAEMLKSNKVNYLYWIFKKLRAEIPITIKIDWIRGIDNVADEFTLAEAETKQPDYKQLDSLLEKC